MYLCLTTYTLTIYLYLCVTTLTTCISWLRTLFCTAGKHYSDYLYPCTNEVMGTWKHYNLSAQTMNERNTRAKSPLVSRELDRYVTTPRPRATSSPGNWTGT